MILTESERDKQHARHDLIFTIWAAFLGICIVIFLFLLGVKIASAQVGGGGGGSWGPDTVLYDTVTSTVANQDFLQLDGIWWNGSAYQSNFESQGVAFTYPSYLTEAYVGSVEFYIYRLTVNPGGFGTDNEDVNITAYELTETQWNALPTTGSYDRLRYDPFDQSTPTTPNLTPSDAVAWAVVDGNTIPTDVSAVQASTTIQRVNFYPLMWHLVPGHHYLLRFSRANPCFVPYDPTGICPLPYTMETKYQFRLGSTSSTFETDTADVLHSFTNVTTGYPFFQFQTYVGNPNQVPSLVFYGSPTNNSSSQFGNATGTTFSNPDFGTLGNYIVSGLSYLFLPDPNTVNLWKQQITSVEYKIPYGYLPLLYDEVDSWGPTSTHLVFTFWVPAMPSLSTSTMDVTQSYLDIPSDIRDFADTWLKRLIWGMFVFYILYRAIEFKE